MENMVKSSFINFWKNKKVFITGHTGFKGAWLTIFLQFLPINAQNYALLSTINPFLLEYI